MSAIDGLLSRAEALRESARRLEATPGSGHHDRDTDPTDRSRLVAPQHQRSAHAKGPGALLPRLSEHLIAFWGEHDVTFLGGDASRAAQALAAYLARYKDVPPYQLTGTEQKLVYRYLPRLAPWDWDGTPALSVRLGEWNDLLHALYEMGVGVTGTPRGD